MTPHDQSAKTQPGSGGSRLPDLQSLETAVHIQGQDTEPRRMSETSLPEKIWIGQTLGKYVVTGILGRGGMGFVLKAHDPLIERDVAIKLLPEDLAEDETALRRFLSEAKSAGKLNHPNAVSIYEIGQEGRAYFLVMELISGGSIADELGKNQVYSVLNATRIMIDACKGMAAAHAVGLIHRDLKPANLMTSADGVVKVTDFGLAKTAGPRAHELTEAGLIVGTPYFMSPEQCEGRQVDSRSDIYSLGATYYSLLTGKNPYQDSSSVIQVMFSHCQGRIPDPRLIDPTIPEACSAIIAHAMAKAPDDRYQLVTEMQADFEAVYATLSGALRIDLPSRSGVRVAPPDPELASQRTMISRILPTRSSPSTNPVGWGLMGVGVCVATAVLFFAASWWKSRGELPLLPAVAAVPAIPTGEPIKIGVLHSLSGTMASSETVVVDATLLAVEEINRAGGLLGRPVKVVVVDGRSDPKVFAAEAERLISQEKVCTVFGCWTSASRKAVRPVFEDHDHLLMYPLQYEGLEESPNIVYMGAAPNQQILPALDWAMTSLQKKRFFLVGSDYVFPRTANAIIKDYLQSKGGEVVGEEYLHLGSQDTAAVMKAILSAKPDMILNTINGDSNIAFFRGLRTAGIAPAMTPCLSFSLAEQELRSLDIDDVVGDYSAWTYFQSIDTPENRQFVERFQEKYPQRVLSDPMETAYVGVKMWANAVNAAQSLEPHKIRRALLNQRYKAPSGSTRIDPDSQHSYKTPRVGMIKADGQFDIVWSAPNPVAPQPYPPTRSAAEWKAFLYDLSTGWGGRWSAP